jgi:hypothetical protein
MYQLLPTGLTKKLVSTYAFQLALSLFSYKVRVYVHGTVALVHPPLGVGTDSQKEIDTKEIMFNNMIAAFLQQVVHRFRNKPVPKGDFGDILMAGYHFKAIY